MSKPAEATNSPPDGKAGDRTGKPLCKFFLGASECKRGGKCTYVHDMSGLTRQDHGTKCLACGPEAHRQKDCPSVGAGSLKGQASSREGDTTSPNKQSALGTGGNQPGIGPGCAEEPLCSLHADGVCGIQCFRILLQCCAAHCCAFAFRSAIRLRAIEPDTDEEGSSVDSSVGLRFVALVDSGATHALRPAVNDSEWCSASLVLVSLASKETSATRISHSGTLLLPPSSSAQTTVCNPGIRDSAAWLSFGLDCHSVSLDCSVP